MTALKKNKSTPESREFWTFVEKKAKEAESATWQKGAIRAGVVRDKPSK